MPLLVSAALCAAASAADAPTLLGMSGGWSAYQATTDKGKVCYVLAKPSDSLPAAAKRNQIYLIISTWPDRQAKNEVEVVFGYPFRDKANATAEVAGKTVQFFTNNDGGSGNGWVSDSNDESAMVDAMRSADKIVIKGVSKRGTKTTDTYALDGLAAALDTINAGCKPAAAAPATPAATPATP